MLKGHKHSVLQDKASYIGDKNRYPLMPDQSYVVEIAVCEGCMIGSRPYIEVSWGGGAGSIPYRSIKELLGDWDFS